MVTVILGALAGLAVTLYRIRRKLLSRPRLYIAGVLLGSVGGTILALIIGLFAPKVWGDGKTVGLQAVSEVFEREERSFAGMGQAKQEAYFYYYSGSAVYELKKVKHDRVRILEVDVKLVEPKVTEMFYVPAEGWELFSLLPRLSKEPDVVVFRVPKGTVGSFYLINLGLR